MKYLTHNSKLVTRKKHFLKVSDLIPNITWLFDDSTPQYAIGDVSAAYQAWCPHNLQYDSVRNKFIFTQQHSSKHGSGATVSPATMYELNPSDPLKKIQIQIPEIRGIANLVILPDGKYVLYPKTATSVRYVSDDGGTTWTSENLSGSSQHFFGVYYCNGEYYAGCDYEWAEYHYSVDGLNWIAKSIGAESNDYEMRTKEHSFCYWKGHVYAFGRRDWYDANNNLIEDRNNCSIVYRLDGEEWTVIDDSSLLAFQSNCSPVAFDNGIAIAHINRTSNATLNYSIYDGTTFSTIKTWSGLVLPNCQNAFTTPALAFGNGYVCIAYSTMPVLHALNTDPYYRAINSIIIGTTEEKTTKDYFVYERLETADAPNVSKIFALTPEKLKFFPSGAEADIAWRWNTGAANPNYDNIINNGTSDAYYYFTDYPNLVHVNIENNCFLVKEGKFVRTVTGPTSMLNDTQKNFIFQYDGRWFAVSGKTTDYNTQFQCAHQFVVECSFADSPTQPSVDISGVPDGAIVRLVSANGGVSEKIKNTVAYITPISDSTN